MGVGEKIVELESWVTIDDTVAIVKVSDQPSMFKCL